MINLITNEGILLLNRSLESNQRLFIDKAYLVDNLKLNSITDAINFKYSDNKEFIESGKVMDLVSMIPILVESGENEGNRFERYAIDLDFAFNSTTNENATYDTIVVPGILGTLVYNVTTKTYFMGEVVYTLDSNNQKLFYKCIESIDYVIGSSLPLDQDTDHWMRVDASDLMISNEQYYYVTDYDFNDSSSSSEYAGTSPSGIFSVYVASYDDSVTINSNIEFHYKVRIFTTTPTSLTGEDSKLVFTTFGVGETEASGTAMLQYLAEISGALAAYRQEV